MVRSIVATIRVKEGQNAQFEAVASRLVEAVRANEPGCLLYTLSRGEDQQTYVFMERYADEEATKAHRASEHFKTYGRQMGEFMDGAPIVLRMNEVV
ncbi:MAG: antibiotic biosynthesis monooxygenase [Gammaproteobacteria bacterium]|nr:antibiotic biosynthesis monooxygenase [Gammaproteobacteria bacterium]